MIIREVDYLWQATVHREPTECVIHVILLCLWEIYPIIRALLIRLFVPLGERSNSTLCHPFWAVMWNHLHEVLLSSIPQGPLLAKHLWKKTLLTFQFAYRTNRSTDDAIALATHTTLSHRENKKACMSTLCTWHRRSTLEGRWPTRSSKLSASLPHDLTVHSICSTADIHNCMTCSLQTLVSPSANSGSDIFRVAYLERQSSVVCHLRVWM